MQAIQTKYFGPGNVRGSRIKATVAAAGSLTIGYDHALNLEDNHKAAAEAFRDRMGWNDDGYGHLVTATLPDGSFCHVMSGR